ncbi:MAG: TniB protein [Firmicutes bacterium]|nr:TniB protein [Bacillota bacterium]
MIIQCDLKITLRGEVQEAVCHEQKMADYANNPLIEALPPVRSPEEVKELLENKIRYSEKDRFLEHQYKAHAIQGLSHFVKPLSRHFYLEGAISRVIRDSYKSRNILKPEFVQMLNKKRILEDVDPDCTDYQYRQTGRSFSLIGTSGVGKSTAIERILLTYPQVIKHSYYEGEPLPYNQLVWLKLNCPHDGNLKGLCLSFFNAVDAILKTDYYKAYCKSKAGIDSLIESMARVAALHSLGILVVDEIQNLNVAKSGGAIKMLNYFTQLIESIGLPVLLIGTPEAAKILQQKFRQQRRMLGQGNFTWNPLAKGEEWDKFVEALMKYQWTEEIVPYSEEISQTLHDRSMGILDVAVKMYQLAQWRVNKRNNKNKECLLSSAVINEVADDCYKEFEKIRKAMKKNDLVELSKHGDIIDAYRMIFEKEGLTTAEEPIAEEDTSTRQVPVSQEKQVHKLAEVLLISETDTDIAYSVARSIVQEHKGEEFSKMAQFALDAAQKIKDKSTS